MLFKHLLIPLDGSQLAESALPLGVALAQRFGSKVTLLRVPEPIFLPTTSGDGLHVRFVISLQQQAYDQAVAYLAEVREQLTADLPETAILTEVVETMPPAEAILHVAKEAGVDTIVMSTHGRSGLSRFVYGSVAGKVLSHSEWPVLLVRAKEEVEIDLPPIQDLADMRSHELVG